MARYHIETYGCTSNRGESHVIESASRNIGHHRVDGPEGANIIIMNICMVVEKTKRNMLRRAKEPAAKATDPVITGCMVLAQGNNFREEGVNTQILHRGDVPAAVTNGERLTPGSGVEPALNGVVSILPIARGYMLNCSYCITKFATGWVDSPLVDENIEKVRALTHANAKEPHIIGQDTDVYGWDNGDRKLPKLLDRICTGTGGEFRVRVGTANPGGVHGVRNELATVFARHNKFYNFIHTPVQSGSGEVLEHMRRRHRVDKFRKIVETFDCELDYRTLSTDFITGYPTGADTSHERSMGLLREVRPEKVNITRSSKRPGTDAMNLKGFGETLKKERSKEMSETKMDIVTAAYDEIVGTGRDILIVEEGIGDSVKCRDEAYRQIIVQNTTEHGLEPGDFARMTMTAHQTAYALAELVEAQPEPREPTAV